MPVLSLVVPCYNSEAYVGNCLASILGGGSRVEVVCVNDGSTDSTPEILDEWARKHPETIRVIHQENRGHGGAVNAGVAAATGAYIKVVDSDDWLDAEALLEVLDTLEALESSGEGVDLLLHNFVYEKEGRARPSTVRLARVLPQGRVFGWGEVGRFRLREYLMMHSMIYSAKVLRESGVLLPEHTFYVDTVWAYEPLPLTRRLYYVDVPLYRYYIGREDQSVNEPVMLRRIEQQIRVVRRIYDFTAQLPTLNPGLERYMLHFLGLAVTVSNVMLSRKGTPQALAQKQAMWEHFRVSSPELHRKLRRTLSSGCTSLPGKAGNTLAVGLYQVARRVVGFN
ncbi:MAG TPA: glycosyltransferase [Actinomycetales bacterium]|nr:glycosyltransferase [Actinomycetales bacterium]